MDPRTHVAQALARLHAAPAQLPPVGTLAYRSRLLDETGGDFRPLVVFLIQLADAGLLAQIQEASVRGEPWEETHRRLSLAWASEHFTQPEMARWAVAAWGAALGRCPVPEEPRPEPIAPPTASASTRASARPVPAPRARGALVPVPAPSPSSTGYSSAARRSSAPGGSGRGASPRPYFSRAEKQALAAIGLTGLVAAGLIAIMSPDEATSSPAASVRPIVAPVTSSSGAATRGAPTPSTDSTASAGASPDSAGALDLAALDLLAVSRLSVAEGARLLPGTYRIATRRQGVYGHERCDALAASIAWDQWTVDTILVDSATAVFRFASRPTLTGTVRRGGVFVTRPVMSERDGTRSSYRLQGQLTPAGFEATSITRTASILRWRRTVECEFVASLSAQRLR